MAHIRKLIRDNINTTLTGLDTTAYNVYQSRVYPMHNAKLPGILIYNKSENVQYSAMGVPRLQERIAEFELQIYVKAKTDYDDKLDQICLEVEQALATDVTRGGYAIDTRVTTFESDFNGDGDQPVAICTLTVEVRYQVRENDLDAAI